MAETQVKSPFIGPGQRAEWPLFSPKQTFKTTDLDSVRMSAFGHKQPSLTYEKYLKFLLV